MASTIVRWSIAQAPKMRPARARAPSSAASHSPKTTWSAESRSMSSLWPTAIRNMELSLHRLEPIPVPIGGEAADRRQRLVAQGDQPVVRGGAGEELALGLDRVQWEVVERRDPARVRAPRPHPEVAEERERLLGTADHDRLVALRVAAGRDDRHARQELGLAVDG